MKKILLALLSCILLCQSFFANAMAMHQQDKELLKAISIRDYDGLRHALEHGAHPNGSTTPLHYAALLGNTEAARLLIEYGADINHADNNGNTPLHLAVCHGRYSVICVLLDNHAHVNLANSAGNTPLHDAACWSAVSIVQLLVRHGAHIALVNHRGETARDRAEKSRSLDAYYLLDALHKQNLAKIDPAD